MIDPSTFKPLDSRWQDIYSCLKKAGFDVYSPGVKLGECAEPYVVVKMSGINDHSFASADVASYSVMCYVPKNAYSTLEPFVRRVREAMKGLMPMVKYAGYTAQSFYDDSVKAHMVSIEYTNYAQKR